MQPFSATRRDGRIVLEIDENEFVAEALGDASRALAVVDREQFLRFALENVFSLTHDLDRDGSRTSWWLRLAEALGQAAAATGSGLRSLERPPPTCGCDPEVHDGG